MKEIIAVTGEIIYVDDEYFDALSAVPWRVIKGGRTSYARTFAVTNKVSVLMHRLIMNTPDGLTVDHIDHNGLNNQKSNLRNCDRCQNAQNVQKQIKRRRKSCFKGITHIKH